MDKVFITTSLEKKPFYMSSVEIIIPFHNMQSKVVNLIEDIFATVQKNKYLITLVDDGSINQSFIEQLKSKEIAGLRFLRHEKSKGFGASVNYALNNEFKSDIPFVAILHSDVRVYDINWLYNLGQSLAVMKEKGVKMISAMTDNPCCENQTLMAKRYEIREDAILSEGFLPMYCVLANRELFHRVGPFVECQYAGVEVEEYAIRMSRKGYKQGVCGTSWVHHEGAGTLSQYAENKKVQEILRKTRNQFDEVYKK